MLHPEYLVVFDPKRIHRFPIGYAVHKNNLILQSILNSWIDIQKSTGNINHLYDYWIQGKGAKIKKKVFGVSSNIPAFML